MKQQKLPASASLITVIALSGVLLIGGMIVVFNSVDLAKASKAKLNNTEAIVVADTCFEESLQKLKINQNYTGNLTVTLTAGNCQATISNHPTQANFRNILISAAVNEYYFNTSKTIDISVSPFQVVK
ncbi:MAG: hypothetical protein WCJ58_00360 [bacterium]